MLSFPKRNECLLGHPQTPKEGRKEEENAEPRDREEDEDKKKKERKAKRRKRVRRKRTSDSAWGPWQAPASPAKGTALALEARKERPRKAFHQ